MSFFAGRPRFEASNPEPPTVEPEWFGPPRGMLPGYLPERVVLFHTTDAILVVGKFDVYPTGVEFSLDLQLRVQDEDLGIPWERNYRRRSADELPDDLIRFGVIDADGSSWSNLDATFPGFGEVPAAPFVMARGGGGGGSSWSMNQWLWPLPPAGTLAFIAEWPKYGVAESRAVIDATALRAAASEAVQLWR